MYNLIKKISQNYLIVNIFYVIFLLIAFSFIILTRQLGDLDEIWNYGFGLNISNGLTPYSEFNMIITPFAAFLSAFMLTVFGKNLLTVRILSVILSTLTILILHRIFLRLGLSRGRAAVYGLASVFIFEPLFTYNYNFLCMIFVLIIIFIQIGNTDKISRGSDFIIGLTAGLCVVTKQSTGLFVCIGIAVLSIVCYKKDFIKSWIFRIFGGGIILTAFFTYMLEAQNFDEFYQYAVAGISDFTNTNTYIDFMFGSGIVEFLAGLIMPVIIILFIIRTVRHSEERKTNLTVLIMTLCGAIVIYPICDLSHFFIAAFPATIMCARLISLKIKGKVTAAKLACAAILYAVIIAEVLIPITDIRLCKESGYEYIPISDELNTAIEEVTGYIKSKKSEGERVIICDTTAQAFMIPCDIYNYVYDLPNKGNFGTRQPIEYAKDLVNSNNTTVLVNRDAEKLNWQFPTEMRDYVISNMGKTGEICFFDIYEDRDSL